jgi:hypothetical protein
MVIRMSNKRTVDKIIFLVEIERKKSPDRVINEKLARYENTLAKLNFKKYNLNAPVKVLIIYANLDYNCFLRPQDYSQNNAYEEIKKLAKQLDHLVYLSRDLPPNRYRFLAFYDFYRLHETAWLMPNNNINRLIP